MHFHCEVIIPPTDDVKSAVESVMAPYYEGAEDAAHSFWDWYVIGGRWAGKKLMARYDQSKIDAFMQWCRDEGVTVSGFQAGKQRLSPADQEGKVDAKWNEMFPSDPPIPCPVFEHSNDEYNSVGVLPGDICRLSEVGDSTPARVIFAGSSYNAETGDFTGPLKAVFMVSDEIWNGTNHEKTAWDGTVEGARKMFAEYLGHHGPEWAKRNTPQDDWLAITVDYHS